MANTQFVHLLEVSANGYAKGNYENHPSLRRWGTYVVAFYHALAQHVPELVIPSDTPPTEAMALLSLASLLVEKPAFREAYAKLSYDRAEWKKTGGGDPFSPLYKLIVVLRSAEQNGRAFQPAPKGARVLQDNVTWVLDVAPETDLPTFDASGSVDLPVPAVSQADGAFQQGCAAHRSGQPRTANPYPMGTEGYEAWDAAWARLEDSARESVFQRAAADARANPSPAPATSTPEVLPSAPTPETPVAPDKPPKKPKA